MNFQESQGILDNIIHMLEEVTEWDDQSTALFQCMKIIVGELEHPEENSNLTCFKDVDKIIQQYYIVKTFFRRFEFELNEAAQDEAFIYIVNTCVSTSMFDLLIDTTTFYKKTLADNFLKTAKRVLDRKENLRINEVVADTLYNHVSKAIKNYKDNQYE